MTYVINTLRLKMKIVAISVNNNNNISDHFGYSEKFIIYQINNNQITNKTVLKNPGHQPGSIPDYLNQNGVNVIICGGIGLSAIKLFNQCQIEVISGIKGDYEKVISDYLSGSLVSDNQACQEHMHQDEHH